MRMSSINVKGIVLKEIPVGESDKRILVFSKEHGKMLLFAKGARNQKSKLLSATQLFAYSNFIIFEGKSFKTVSSADLIESFYNVRSDILKLSYSSYFLELIEKTVLEEMEEEEVLKLLLKTLMVVSKTDFDIKLCARIFEIKLMQLLGFLPDINVCGICGKNINTQYLFYAHSGAIVCSNCNSKPSLKISNGSVLALKHIMNNDLNNIFKFNVSENVLSELTSFSKLFLNLHIDERFKTLDFAESLQ